MDFQPAWGVNIGLQVGSSKCDSLTTAMYCQHASLVVFCPIVNAPGNVRNDDMIRQGCCSESLLSQSLTVPSRFGFSDVRLRQL